MNGRVVTKDGKRTAPPETAFQMQLPAIIGKVAGGYYPLVTLP